MYDLSLSKPDSRNSVWIFKSQNEESTWEDSTDSYTLVHSPHISKSSFHFVNIKIHKNILHERQWPGFFGQIVFQIPI